MFTWKAHLRDVLERLAVSHGHASLSEIGAILCGVLDAQEVAFSGDDGRALDASLLLTSVIGQPLVVTIRVACRAGRTTVATHDRVVLAGAPGTSAPAGTPSGGPPMFVPDGAGGWSAPQQAAFIQEFDRLERRRGFMWAGYVVKEMLPRLGYGVDQAKRALDELLAQQILKIEKVANPRNPEFPATSVRLNRDNPLVQAALARHGDDARAPATESEPAATSEKA